MRTRILVLILLVVLFQLITYTAVLVFGGEFRDLKEHSCSALVERTESIGLYVQGGLQGKPTLVETSAGQINGTVSRLLRAHGASISALKTNEALAQDILASSAGELSELLDQAEVNDVYLILDTGGDGEAKAALYLQSVHADVASDAPLMVFGPESIAQEAGFAQPSDGPQSLVIPPERAEDFDFYYTTLATAREQGASALSELGYWSRFSRVSSAVIPTMKYSLPLISENGTVYGVLGVGLTEDAILTGIPSYDLSRDKICYVLGYRDASDRFAVLAHSGPAYSALLGDADTLRITEEEGAGLYRFEMVTDVDLLGGVGKLELYDESSPYRQQEWAMVSVADRASILWSLLFLQRMLVVSAILSLMVAAVVAIPGCSVIIKPLSNLSRQIKSKRKYNEVIRFQPTNIYEVDEITDAITQLQINVHGFSSQVSKMISVADVGLGTFMYDRTDDSVFVGQSLIKVLRLNLPQGEDIVMSREEFLSTIEHPEIQTPIVTGLDMAKGEMREDFNEVYQIKRPGKGTLWLRMSFTYSPNTIIGIVQDITNSMIERTRIEHERDYDTLTDLLTRHAYYRRLEEIFQDRDALKTTALVMIDLDNLKYVNDTYGHGFGDSYIKTAASVLKKFRNHGGIVARLSGDEFNVCLAGFSSKEEIRQIIGDIRTELLGSSCLLADGTHYRVSASMGVSWYPDDAESRELLMKYADFAMYTVKHSTKGGIAEFNMEAYSNDSARVTDFEELNRIIEESRVQYAFQSIVSVETGEIYGYEALMRVRSEIFRSPLELLNIAKSSAKLHEIERLTWTRALADFHVLVDAGRIGPDARIFINSIANHRLEDEVVAALEKAHPHLLHRVVMEILESESADKASITHKEQVIHRWGGQFALDDYGTGYNSEYALLNLQPNIIKIDRSIISGCDKDPDRHMIIENLVKLAKAKSILVLAEGVETQEEMATAIACGVDFLQGYYLARPVFEPEPIAPELAQTIRRMAQSKGTP